MPKLVVQHLSKYFGELEALRDISLDVERGGFVSVVGPSGCGKTTFLRIVAGLEPANGGEVQIDGRVVTRPGSDRGFVFQTDCLLPWRTVLANALIGPEIAGRSGPAGCRKASPSTCRARVRWRSSAPPNSCAMWITSGA